MPIEIERKFLVCSDEWRTAMVAFSSYRQAYLARTSDSCVRVRRSENQATITVKGPHRGIARHEFEYPIPAADADDMLDRLCVTPVIEKVRHWVEHAGMIWEVDVYQGEASGLVLAEVELARVDQPFALPRWVSAEVTLDPRYHSAGIVQGLWRGCPVRENDPPRRRLRGRGEDTPRWFAK
jgi:adenylate cyclase